MNNFELIDPKEISNNITHLIGDDWMLISSGKKEHFNVMTASWGGTGFLWGKPVAFVFIRPQRYTFEFTETNDCLSLSFFDVEKYRKALTFCGKYSGRDTDKVKACDLTACFTENGTPCYEEASLILEGKKLYADFLKPEAFVDPALIDRWYAAGDYHKMYVVEIVSAWQKKKRLVL